MTAQAARMMMAQALRMMLMACACKLYYVVTQNTHMFGSLVTWLAHMCPGRVD